MTDVITRFLEYIKIDTKSDEASKSSPTTKIQFDLAKKLVEELKGLGIDDVSVDENCYVIGTLPSNTDKKIPVIGFIAHMDTSPDMSGTNVNPQFVENYNGKDIILNKEKNIVLSPDDFPELNFYLGQTLITTDGTTLLGADDKAGIAEIMTAIEYLSNNPDIKHGTIKIAFTPDEEVGKGTDHFDVKKFGAECAYTLDGGRIGELEFENFNAAKLTVTVKGRNVHPGYAKNKMINSMLIAMEFNSMLPVNQTPFYTEKYEGFFHMINIKGEVEETVLTYIVRDHDMGKFKEKQELSLKIADYLNHKHGKDTVTAELTEQYLNMREKIEPVMHIVDIVEQAMKDVGVEPKKTPIRGGTDGSKLSYMGLPTPNIFTGGHNYHGRFEYIPVESMKKAVEVILKIIELYTEKQAVS